MQILQTGIGIIGVGALSVFLVTIVIGVPSFMLYVARLGPDRSSDVRRLNYRLFKFARRVFYLAFFSILLYQLISTWRDNG